MSVAFGFLSPYPPTQCGLATFTAGMLRSLTTATAGEPSGSFATAARDRGGVVRVVETVAGSSRPEVIAQLDRRAGSADGAAAALNMFDVAVIQHEYGIYGGIDGEDVLEVLRALRVPVIVVAHTVLARPTPHQRQVLERVVESADAVVTMTVAARERLIHGFRIDSTKVTVIPHGADLHAPAQPDGDRPLILTWGLLGPGKGIEWAVDGLRRVRQLRPAPSYVVAGQTHPGVRTQQGEQYRLQLRRRARAGGVSDLVHFLGAYLDGSTLAGLLRRASVVLLPYDSREQVTSGVLVEAVAAGKPVIATRFPHAVELLSTGAGILVPHFDGPAIGDALHRVLTESGLAAGMAEEAGRLAPTMSWRTVAAEYQRLAHQLLAARTNAGQLLAKGAAVSHG